jgi:hypothetical protein
MRRRLYFSFQSAITIRAWVKDQKMLGRARHEQWSVDELLAHVR